VRWGEGAGFCGEVFTLASVATAEGFALRRILFLRWRGEGRVFNSSPSTLSVNSNWPNSLWRIWLPTIGRVYLHHLLLLVH
jgi:hypothetical protein